MGRFTFVDRLRENRPLLENIVAPLAHFYIRLFSLLLSPFSPLTSFFFCACVSLISLLRARHHARVIDTTVRAYVRAHGEIRCKQGWKNVGKVIDECYISGVYANTATSRAPIAGIIQRGRLLPAGAIFPREESPLSLSLLARENAHLLTFYNSMLIKSSNIVLRAIR